MNTITISPTSKPIIVNTGTTVTTQPKQVWPTVTHFMNADEIADDFVNTKISSGDKAILAKNDRTGLANAFFFSSVGMYMRNSYYLWHPDNPYTVLNHVPDIQGGVDVSPQHPDNYSAIVMDKIIKLCQTLFPTDAAMVQMLKDLGLAKS